MKGVYCLLVVVPKDTTVNVGALGRKKFARGSYVYVGSGMGGVEHRVGRHRSMKKKLRWHIDYLLRRADLVASIVMQSSSEEAECEMVRTLSMCESTSFPIRGFGSSDCGCPSHLVYFGDVEPEVVMEELTARLSMLESAYPRRVA